MKTAKIWGILLLVFAIPISALRDCESCHKHHENRRKQREYDFGDGKLRQNRSGYTFTDQIHPADYHDNIDRVNRGNAEPFGPQEFEDYGDSEYEEYNNPYEDNIHYSASLDANNQTICNDDCSNCTHKKNHNPYSAYMRYSRPLNLNKQTTYVDYLPTYYRTYPYYIGHKSGPFFGNSYGF